MQLRRQRRYTRRMAVPKESTFPPIFQTYSPGLKATGRSPKPLSQCKATTQGIRFLLEEEKAKKRGMKEKGRAVLPLKDERELELKRKRAKVSESALVQYFSSRMHQFCSLVHSLSTPQVSIVERLGTRLSQCLT